jgi:hypothetical protein
MCMESLISNNISDSEHILSRLVSLHLISLYYLYKTRRLQTLVRTSVEKFSIVPALILSVLLRFSSSTIRQMCLQILNDLLIPEYYSTYQQLQMAQQIVHVRDN